MRVKLFKSSSESPACIASLPDADEEKWRTVIEKMNGYMDASKVIHVTCRNLAAMDISRVDNATWKKEIYNPDNEDLSKLGECSRRS